MRTHTYTAAKGYAEKYKGREISWPVPESVTEAVESGEFKDEKTLVRYAVAQLNIRKGHAIQAATVETVKDAEGKDTGKLVSPDLSVKDMEKIARETRATGDERIRAGGNQKVRAEKFATAKQKAAERAKNATPEQLAILRDLGLLDEAEATPAAKPAAPAAAAKPAQRR
jgi:Arc/MetJ-type ribon-helix-helix transcriptional regulator